ncbi:fumarate reductase flavoprotein subunit [Natranaerovirga hydrolytica]|uniref:Urocanate reductase n=1 Tax=Natranaerovirga hydrolytica TaxID=680378 RepID=A0A4R1MFK8_9FIRM|nr:FAD-dependent oxidoreductase [Natranaerovirga hydrolytica]TCK90522.1 fumarate reductase flavoprotein subunit [Natranaerovirga hydrolytica]
MKKKGYMKKIILCMVLMFSLLLIGCNTSNEDSPNVESNGLKNGTFEGEGNGYIGPIKVEVTLEDGNIGEVVVVEHNETENIANAAINEIPSKIVEHQSVAVDSVTGATGTSKGIVEATTAALLSAGADEADISKAIERNQEEIIEELEADVVVVGAGGAGVSAAVTAAENGANVIVIEKTAIPGGTTAMGGGFFAADSEQARSMGHDPLDTDMIFDMWMGEMDWLADGSLVRQFLELSHTTADWMEERGIEFHKEAQAVQQTHAEGTNGYHKYDNFTQTSAQLGNMLDRIVEEYDASVYYQTPAIDLISEDGAIKGVIAQGNNGITYHIKADSIVLATGGFVGNSEMVSEALNGVTVNASGYNTNVGDGINMAINEGAATRSMQAMVLHTFNVDGGEFVEGDYEAMDIFQGTTSVAYMPIVPWLNGQGFRFANEDMVYDRALSTNALVAQGNYGWFLYNETLLNILENEGAGAAGMQDSIAMGPYPNITPLDTGWNHLTEIVEQMVDGGGVIKADTLEELAQETGMDETILLQTMARYNEDARNGVDTAFNKRTEHMFELSEGPYYAFKVTPNNLSTAGGIRINSNFQVVLDNPEVGYTPIPNLYAAGADAGGLYSDHYAHTIEGAAQGWAYNSGRLAGARAAENALNVQIDLFNE